MDCTSDGEGGSGLQLPHPVLRHTGEGTLVVDGSLLHPQHIIVLVVLDLVSVKKKRRAVS